MQFGRTDAGDEIRRSLQQIRYRDADRRLLTKTDGERDNIDDNAGDRSVRHFCQIREVGLTSSDTIIG